MRTKSIDSDVIENHAAFDAAHSDFFQLMRSAIDAQHAFTRSFYGFVGNQHLTNHGEAETPVFSALTKNELALYASLSLTRDGFYGVAMNQMRLVYEALVIAKVAAILRFDPLIEKWKKGDTIYFTNGVIKRIKSPELTELYKLWPILCEHSHASIYSVQISTKFSEIGSDTKATLAVIGMLLSCNYHLLNRHFITPQMVAIGKRYFEHGHFSILRTNAKQATGAVGKYLSPLGRVVVREYSSKWSVV